ncbi:hypothetical protein Tco_0851347 [Tanacetum coccineum]
MSLDSASSEVTYTSISSHGDPLAWAVDFFRLQEPDSPEAASASPNYVPGPEEPEQAPLLPDYVPGPEYPEYLALSDEEVLVEDQPYTIVDSPIALSLGYVANSDPEEDSEDGPVDYLADRGDSNDDDSSDNDEREEEEEEEHLALADSVVAPVVDRVPSSEETESFEIDESAATPPSPLAYRTTARISIRPEAPMPFPSEEEVERLLSLPPPPPSPLILLSPPFVEESLARCLAAPTLPSSPLPSLPVSLFIPPSVDRREEIPKAELPPCKRLCLTTLTSRYEVGESSTANPRHTGGHRADYRFIDTIDAEIRRQRADEVGYGIRDVWEQDTHDIHAMIENGQDRQTQLFQRVDGLGQLSAALGQIQALQARGQTHADDREGAASTAVGIVFSFLVSDNHPRRSSATAAAATPMTAAAVEQLIEEGVIRGTVRTPHEYTYKDFLNCNPLTFKGTEGVVVLSQWFEKMESVFHISNCAVENQVKFATCSFLGNALTWWNSHMKTVTQDVAYAMDWKTLKKMMTNKYCPKGEIKKMFDEESDEVEKYVGGLPDMIWGNVMSYQPKKMEKAIEFANDQMDQKVLTIAERQAEQKRKLEFNAGNN